ncbi:hypothetical protein [Candidatus Methylacidithermus pantelleriae]|nr:hypothetical protein [Candidatus Methylacidithermus pantelleriae]
MVFYDSTSGNWVLLNPAGGLLTAFQNPGLIGHVLRATNDVLGQTPTSGGTTTLYWLPWKGRMTSIWDSTSNRWRILEFGGVSFSISGSAANTLYAIGAYWNGSSVVFGSFQVSNANFLPSGFFTDPVWGVASGGINWRLIGWYYTKGTTPSVYWNESVGGLLSFDICNVHGESKYPFVVGGPVEIIVGGSGPFGFCTARQSLSTSYGSWSNVEPNYEITIGTVTLTPYGQSAAKIPGSAALVGRAAQNWGNVSGGGSTFLSYTTLFSHIGPYFCGSITGNVDLVTWYA